MYQLPRIPGAHFVATARLKYPVPRCTDRLPHFPSCSSIQLTISSLHHAPANPSCCRSLAPRAGLLLTSSTASIKTICCCHTSFNQPEFDRLARDVQSSAHYRYLLAYPHRPRHRLARPPLPGAPHCQLLIKSISPLSGVTSRFLPINSLIPLTNFGNPKSHLSPLVAISYHYSRLSTRIDAIHPGLV